MEKVDLKLTLKDEFDLKDEVDWEFCLFHVCFTNEGNIHFWKDG